MVSNIPIVTFDTSAHNKLAKDDPLAEQVFTRIRSEMLFRFAGLSFEEIYATPDPFIRAKLLMSCRRLQEGPSDCLYPHDEMLKLLIEAHAKSPVSFDWQTVGVLSHEYADEIAAGKLVGDAELLAEHLQEQNSRQKQYKNLFAQLRPMLEPVFKTHGEARPSTFRQFLKLLEESNQTLIAGFGKALYDAASGYGATNESVRAFLEACPPARAFNFALLMSWFGLAVGDKRGEKFKAGRNDLFMAIYLPYCNVFVTAEEKGEQEKCLREIVSVAGLDTEVISYDRFRSGLLIAA